MFREKLVFFAGILLFGISASSLANQVARYEAEGNANDTTGLHNGSLINGAGFGSGVFGQAFSFSSASQQYVTVLDDPAWTLGSGDFSLSLWTNFTTIAQGGVGSLPNTFLAHDEGGGGNKKWVFGYDGNGDLFFHINGPGGSAFISPAATIAPTVGVWHMYTLTRSASTYSYYYDAGLVGTATNSLTIGDAAAPLTIGQAEGIGYLNGRVDDVQIYNNALTSTQVTTLVPEPASIVTAGFGLLFLLGRRKRR